MASTAALCLVIIVLSALLAAPSIVYVIEKPNVTNLLSLVFTIGFYIAISCMVQNRTALIVVGILALLLNLVEIVSIVAFGGLISLGGIEAILYVDPIEAREFALEHRFAIACGLLIVPMFVGLVMLKNRLDRLSRQQRIAVVLLALLAPGASLFVQLLAKGSRDDVFLPTRIVEHYVAFVGANPLTTTLSGLATTLAGRAELRAAEAAAQNAVHFTAQLAAPAQDEVFVVVIGESSRRKNWSLYGYRRPTTPELDKESGLIPFMNVTSPATVTSRSVPLSFYFPEPTRNARSQHTHSFVSAFKAVGFKTFWISNQGTHRTAVGSQINLLMHEADVVESTNYGFWNSVLDGALLPELDKALGDPAHRKLIVLHTLGSHTNYRQRYPSDWNWTFERPAAKVHTSLGISEADARIIDEYDGSIVYTDWLLHEVISRTRDRKTYAAVIYFSDHGERLYDDKSRAKGHGFGDFKPIDVEIPFAVWLSEAFATVSPDKRKAIAANACNPVSTGDLAASMLDLAGIKVAEINPAPSFFEANYQSSPRQVLMIDDRLQIYQESAARPCD